MKYKIKINKGIIILILAITLLLLIFTFAKIKPKVQKNNTFNSTTSSLSEQEKEVQRFKKVIQLPNNPTKSIFITHEYSFEFPSDWIYDPIYLKDTLDSKDQVQFFTLQGEPVLTVYSPLSANLFPNDLAKRDNKKIQRVATGEIIAYQEFPEYPTKDVQTIIISWHNNLDSLKFTQEDDYFDFNKHPELLQGFNGGLIFQIPKDSSQNLKLIEELIRSIKFNPTP